MPNCAQNISTSEAPRVRLSVLIPTPAHSAIGSVLSWEHSVDLELGTLVRVPLGKRVVLGIIWFNAEKEAGLDTAIVLKPIKEVLEGITPLGRAWCELINFTARYYQRSVGEVALSALPPALRELEAVQLARVIVKHHKQCAAVVTPQVGARSALPMLSEEQHKVVEAFSKSLQSDKPAPALLFGATGSGKTEVYMRLTQKVLERAAERQEPAQVLVMVPEINLTPQLEARFFERFSAGLTPATEDASQSQEHTPPVRLCTLHSGMTPAQRLQSWLMAHHGHAHIVLGTRLASLASLPHLRLIIVDEEHDPSFKSQDGARHSARDLAIWRAHHEGIAVLLGSATPSLESWQAAQAGRYQLLRMEARFGQATPLKQERKMGKASRPAHLPPVRLVNMQLYGKGGPKKATVLTPVLKDAIAERVARGEQSLMFLNRRGYAPVLSCSACGWKSACPHCSAFRVFHKADRSLRCHHCGYTSGVPKACPDCGNLDIGVLGRGTERIEEELALELADVLRPNGEALRILRIDADTTKLKGHLESQLAQVHAREVDILVGTQMVTKGHDFRHITLVAALNPDGALFSTDFRAAERLFSLLLQAAGRAGRDAKVSAHSEVLIQTSVPEHPLFQCLQNYDFEHFAKLQLDERQAAAMPPFSYQALVRAEGRTQEVAQTFLQAAREAALQVGAPESRVKGAELVQIYPPVPMSLARLADVERAQMLIESSSRPALQNFLSTWQHTLRSLKPKGIIRWAIDVDPVQI